MRGAAFLDRDGVINIDSGFAHRSSDIAWVDSVFEAVQALNSHGLFVFVVTNQSGVARGLYTEQHVQDLHAWMALEFTSRGAQIDDFMYCPHHPDSAITTYRQVCGCRKPAPGMLRELMQKWPVDPGRSFMIGDRGTDLQAAAAAGVAGHLFAGGNLKTFVDAILKPSSR